MVPLFHWSDCVGVDVSLDGWVGSGFFCALAGRLEWLGSELGWIGLLGCE